MVVRIPFNKPPITGKELLTVKRAVNRYWKKGEHFYVNRCEEWFKKEFPCKDFFLSSSCTHALESCALMLDIQPGDEVIMPSYTFVSTANAFALRGANIVFVDIDPATMNINPLHIEGAITKKTKAIVVIHYGGVACAIDRIMEIASHHQLIVIEDAAHAIMAYYKQKHLGTIGHMGTLSFHETKNLVAGEGGGWIINEEKYIARAKIIREKGTNRTRFLEGEIDRYSWVGLGSSYIMSELNAAFLFAQLQQAEVIQVRRHQIWQQYYEAFEPLARQEKIILPFIPPECQHNAHLFYIKTKNQEERSKLMNWLRARKIQAVFHFVPLHSSEAGMKFGRFYGEDKYTTLESGRLLRLPLYYNLKEKEVIRIIEAVHDFYEKAA